MRVEFSIGVRLVGAAMAGFLVAVWMQAWALAGVWAILVVIAYVVGVWLEGRERQQP